MLNGDVLTDIDLTAQLAQHERTGARATLALVAVEDPSAYGLVPPSRRRGARVRREARPRADRHQPDQRRRLHPRAQVLDGMAPAGTQRLDRARGLPDAGRARPVRLSRPTATGWTSARPSATSRRPSTSSRATSSTEVGDALGALRVGAPATARVEGRVVAPALVGAGCTIGAGRSSAAGRARRARDVGPGRTSRARSCSTASASEVGSTISGSIVGAGRQIGDRLPHRRRRGARRGRHGRVGKHPHRRRAYLPRRAPARRSDQVLTGRWRPDPRRDRVRSTPPADRRHPRRARSPARRAVAGRVGQPPAAGRPGRARRRRDGRVRDRRRAGPRGAGRPRLAADRARARLRAAGLDDPGHDRAVRELLGRHRGDAGVLRGRRGARGARGSWPRPAASWPKRRVPTACR